VHLTLKFLGDISPSSIEFIKQMLRNEAENVTCFDIHLAGLGAFPTMK
jgi:2'-5' RNA ligase